jgi:KipI family sensor histidine kinase inhibitor
MVGVRALPVGPRAVLLEVADVASAVALAAHCRAASWATEVVPAARTVLLDGLTVPTDRVAAALASWTPEAHAAAPGGLVELPVVLDGADLPDVARRWGCTRAEVVAMLTATTFTSAFCGFAPGFSYLSGLPADRTVPRLPSPRPRVPAGSVALAGEWAGVYPTASPGGWRLVGRTDATLWDADREPPALLAPGTRVRFVEV